MQTATLVPIHVFCINHNIDVSFIHSLQKFGLAEIIEIEETAFIPEERLTELELFVRLHRELDINLEGIDAISHLLQRIKKMQDDLLLLQNRLSRYETPE